MSMLHLYDEADGDLTPEQAVNDYLRRVMLDADAEPCVGCGGPMPACSEQCEWERGADPDAPLCAHEQAEPFCDPRCGIRRYGGRA